MHSSVPITFAPGFKSEDSPFSGQATYRDGSLVRFWKGKPQRWGGWEYATPSALSAPARGGLSWGAIDGTKITAFGTATGLYLLINGIIHDITPIGLTDGLVDTLTPTGWGDLGWSEGPWSGSYLNQENQGRARTWSLDNWGEDLVANPRDGTIYHWKYSDGPTVRATAIPNAPQHALGIFVTDDRHLIALGASKGAVRDPLRVAWPNRETLDEWTSLDNNTAGDLRCENGNEIIGHENVRGGYVILTDTTCHAFNYIGGEDVFGLDREGSQSGGISPHGSIEIDGVAIWVSQDGFRRYNGAVGDLECDIQTDFLADLNKAQAFKIHAGTNRAFGEGIWFYPSKHSIECDSYVAVSPEGWTRGKLARTTWIDESVAYDTPIATDPFGYIHRHDFGDTANGDPVEYWLETNEIAIDEGQHVAASESIATMRKVVPDYKYVEGTHTLTVKTRGYPMKPQGVKGPYNINITKGRFSPRASGKSFVFRFEGNGKFRMGDMIAHVTKDRGRP